MDGEMNLIVDTTSAPALTIAVDNASLTVVSGTETASLSGFSVISTIDPLAGTAAFAVDGSLMGSGFDGEVQIATTAPVQLDTNGAPAGGQLVITGADGATITVDILSAQQVELNIDLDGNGSVDEVVLTTWDALQG
jgi:hypothetical protein